MLRLEEVHSSKESGAGQEAAYQAPRHRRHQRHGLMNTILGTQRLGPEERQEKTPL
jgi:hypothetical protein